MLAGSNRFQREIDVRARRREDEDGIDVRLLDHLIIFQILLTCAEQTHARLRAGLIPVAHRNDLGSLIIQQVGQVVRGGYNAAPDDPYLHFV